MDPRIVILSEKYNKKKRALEIFMKTGTYNENVVEFTNEELLVIEKLKNNCIIRKTIGSISYDEFNKQCIALGIDYKEFRNKLINNNIATKNIDKRRIYYNTGGER